jgi:hypothetical protein
MLTLDPRVVGNNHVKPRLGLPSFNIRREEINNTAVFPMELNLRLRGYKRSKRSKPLGPNSGEICVILASGLFRCTISSEISRRGKRLCGVI